MLRYNYIGSLFISKQKAATGKIFDISSSIGEI